MDMGNLKLGELNKDMLETNLKTSEVSKKIPLEDIEPNEFNFYEVEESNIVKLAEEIRIMGQIEDLIVTYDKDNGKYIIISGHRRYNALVLLDEKYANCKIRKYENEQEQELALITANSQRVKNSEEVKKEILYKKKLYTKLKEDGHERFIDANINKLIAEEVGKDISTVTRTIAKDKKPVEKTPKEPKDKKVEEKTGENIELFDVDEKNSEYSNQDGNVIEEDNVTSFTDDEMEIIDDIYIDEEIKKIKSTLNKIKTEVSDEKKEYIKDIETILEKINI